MTRTPTTPHTTSPTDAPAAPATVPTANLATEPTAVPPSAPPTQTPPSGSATTSLTAPPPTARTAERVVPPSAPLVGAPPSASPITTRPATSLAALPAHQAATPATIGAVDPATVPAANLATESAVVRVVRPGAPLASTPATASPITTWPAASLAAPAAHQAATPATTGAVDSVTVPAANLATESAVVRVVRPGAPLVGAPATASPITTRPVTSLAAPTAHQAATPTAGQATVPATNPVPDAVRLARAYLSRVAEPFPAALAALVAEVGPIEAAERVRAGEISPSVASQTSARRTEERAHADLAAIAKAGGRLVVPEDEEWPRWPLLELENVDARRCGGEPLALWVRGPHFLADAVDRAVAVVGSRASSGYGEQVAGEFAHGLALAGMTVVSGAAYGIDGAAHRGAFAAGGLTIAVLACGADVAYPAGHQGLLAKVAREGLIVSEYPPGVMPARHRFLTRNRLIAALGGGTVVVEAGRRSGAKNTAAITLALGRPLMVVPGPVTSASSVGCHELLRDGRAVPVSSVAEIVESVGRFGDDLATEPAEKESDLGAPHGEAMRVYEALGKRNGVSDEVVSVESGVPLERVRALLPELELAGLALQLDEGWQKLEMR
ncbi:DNA-processing protein DprA [Lentzea sp. NPDC092896]|uniref:DNA-processing protein DprA n=1 Tax=Lentzea sp. NPDC092896 TaxID=3364127 RepID=UPI00381AAC82